MTLSLLVNNGRLTLAGSGKLPKTTDCCCDTAPKLCLCPDLCVYKLAMTSPANISTPFTCDHIVSFDVYGGPSLHSLLLPGWSLEPPVCTHGSGTDFFQSFGNGDGEQTAAAVYRTLGFFLGTIRHEGTFFNCFENIVDFQGAGYFGAFATYEVELQFKADCRYDADSRSYGFFIYYGRRSISVRVTPVPVLGQGLLTPIYSRTSIQEIPEHVPLTSACKPYDRDKFCFDPPADVVHDIVYLDGDVSISLPGGFQDFPVVSDVTIDQSAGWPDSSISSAASTLFGHCEAAAAEFTISSRPSCKPAIACNCATSLAGLKVTFEGKEFVMGTEATVSESGAYFETWTHDAPGTFRYRKNDLSNNETYIDKEVEVYCQTDNAASPPVDRWYAAFINWCKDEANYATTYNEDYFIGYFECEPASDCAPFAAETSIPTGSPIDVERVDGWPQGSGCTVPGPATITLSQDCG